jgi:hypothetical protein
MNLGAESASHLDRQACLADTIAKMANRYLDRQVDDLLPWP